MASGIRRRAVGSKRMTSASVGLGLASAVPVGQCGTLYRGVVSASCTAAMSFALGSSEESGSWTSASSNRAGLDLASTPRLRRSSPESPWPVSASLLSPSRPTRDRSASRAFGTQALQAGGLRRHAGCAVVARKTGTVPRSAIVELGAVQSPFSASLSRLGLQSGRGSAAGPRPFSPQTPHLRGSAPKAVYATPSGRRTCTCNPLGCKPCGSRSRGLDDHPRLRKRGEGRRSSPPHLCVVACPRNRDRSWPQRPTPGAAPQRYKVTKMVQTGRSGVCLVFLVSWWLDAEFGPARLLDLGHCTDIIHR